MKGPPVRVRTIVYIDGFNLYYGACRAPGRRWLDLSALSTRLLPNDEIVEIGYFTANIKRDPQNPYAQDRQRLYHRALRTIPNLEIWLGRYISKKVRGELIDPGPEESRKRTVVTYEEKGTDVNLATRLLRDGFEGRYESAVVVSNDGDLKMPIQVVSFIRLSASDVTACQFPERLTSPKGAMLAKPVDW